MGTVLTGSTIEIGLLGVSVCPPDPVTYFAANKACLGQRVNCESVPQVVVVDFLFCIQHQSDRESFCHGHESPVVPVLLGKRMLHTSYCNLWTLLIALASLQSHVAPIDSNHAGSREQILISRVLHKIDTAQCLVEPKSREGSLFPSFLLMTPFEALSGIY